MVNTLEHLHITRIRHSLSQLHLLQKSEAAWKCEMRSSARSNCLWAQSRRESWNMVGATRFMQCILGNRGKERNLVQVKCWYIETCLNWTLRKPEPCLKQTHPKVPLCYIQFVFNLWKTNNFFSPKGFRYRQVPNLIN